MVYGRAIVVFGVICFISLADGAILNGSLGPTEEVRSVSPSTRIVAGWSADEGQIPHQVCIRMANAAGHVNICGGSIIHHNWVVTAAHCIDYQFTFTILFGLTDRNRPEVILETHQKYVHPEYHEFAPGRDLPDIGLIRIYEDVPYSRKIQPVRMMSSTQKNIDFSGVRLTASGFGLTDDFLNGGYISETLLWVYLRGISNTECHNWFSSTIVSERSLCAQYYNDTSQSTCTGDSGGPLTFLDFDGRPTLIGVCSFGSSFGCNNEAPSGWVRPGHYHDWFKQITGLNFDWVPPF